MKCILMKDVLTKYELEKYVLQKSRNRFNKALKTGKNKKRHQVWRYKVVLISHCYVIINFLARFYLIRASFLALNLIYCLFLHQKALCQ